MHPTLMHEIARYRQADLLREAERARLAHLATASDEPRRWFPFRRRTRRTSLRPALG
ncbi:MAG TPA: hypothetical protein VFV62_05950 [Gaiellaceae bacterium]|nr:hypothetical protein [Gaiellaceae bacterium]